MTDVSDRGRGILAPIDRTFLIGEKEYKHRQSAYNRRDEIRTRVENGLQDFTIIAENLDTREREKIFGAQRPREERIALQDGMRDLIRFLYVGLGRTRFEQILREGIQDAEADLGHTDIPLTVAVNLDVDPQADYSLEETAHHIENRDWAEIDSGGALGFLKFAEGTPGFDANQIVDQVTAMSEGDLPIDELDPADGDSDGDADEE